jgi:hypothetical protein
MLTALISMWFVPVAMVLGCIDLVMAIGNRFEIKVKKSPTQ